MYEIMSNGLVVATVSSFEESQDTFHDYISRPITRREWQLMLSTGLTIDRVRYSVDYVASDAMLAAA